MSEPQASRTFNASALVEIWITNCYVRYDATFTLIQTVENNKPINRIEIFRQGKLIKHVTIQAN